MPPSHRTRIVLNLLIKIIIRRDQIPVSEAVKLFDLDESSLLGLIHVLSEHRILTIQHTADGERIIGRGEVLTNTGDYLNLREKIDLIIYSLSDEELEIARKAEEELSLRLRNKVAGEMD